MAEYVNIEYRISKDGKITEKVIGASGSSCQETTASIEKALGEIADQSLLPEYYEGNEHLSQSEILKNSQS
jgi:Protein of unknown function (DUF2997)